MKNSNGIPNKIKATIKEVTSESIDTNIGYLSDDFEKLRKELRTGKPIGNYKNRILDIKHHLEHITNELDVLEHLG